MSSKSISPNHREILSAQSSITGQQEYLTSTNGALNINGSSGGGTQYPEGSTTSPATGTVALGRYNVTPPTLLNGQLSAAQLDINGNLKTSILSDGVVSTANSTTSNLAGGAVFTGTSEDVSDYSAIQVSVFSSHASATDGLSLQQSSDGTNWDFIDVYTITATTGKVFSVQPSSQFFRLVYTNGATLTTSLRIKTVFHVIAPNPSSQRSSDAYTNETDLTQTWAFNSIYDPTNNTWNRARQIATGIQGVGVTDGTNNLNILKSDGTAAGQNSALIAGSYLSVPFTTTTVQAVGTTDAGDYNYVSVHQTSAGTSSVTTFQGSNDNTNWVSIALVQPSNTLSSPSTTGANATIFSGALGYRYFRLNITGISAGTTAGTIVFFTNRSATLTSVAGQVALNGTLTANINGTPAAIADTFANPSVNQIGALGESFNGTNWDRNRNNNTAVVIAAGTTTTQTGITFTTYNAKRLMLLANITAGAGSIVVAINAVSASGYTTNLLTSASLTGVGTTALRIFDGATPSVNLVANDTVPRTVSVTVTVTGTITYGVDYILGV